MPNYQEGKIYAIIDNTNGNKYIGSTTQKISERLSCHRCHYRQFKKGTRKSGCASFQIVENNNYEIILIEDYPCNTKRELEKREQYWLDTIDNINITRSYMTKEDRLAMNRVLDKKRTRNHKPYLKKYRDYRNSWGGDIRSQNNLLLIDINLYND